MKQCIFSGRFDPPHLGHYLTINRLMIEYDTYVVVLDDSKWRCMTSAQDAIDLFNLCFENHTTKPVIIKDPNHFGYITKDQLSGIANDLGLDNWVYVGGNEEVNKHIKSLGFSVRFIRRSYIYSGESVRKSQG